MKRRKKWFGKIVVFYVAGIFLFWTAPFWRNLFTSPIVAWTALDPYPSLDDVLWPYSSIRNLVSKPPRTDFFAQSAQKYRAAQLVAEKDRAPTGMTLAERDSAAFLFKMSANNARQVDVTVLRNMHAELPTRYRYQYIEALNHFATALRQNDAVLWEVAESQMAAYDAWRAVALPDPKP